MTNSLPWKISMLLIGKPSISTGHLYHGYVSHNQRKAQVFTAKLVRSVLLMSNAHPAEIVFMNLAGESVVLGVQDLPYP
jgi:hypothetical protein